MTEAKASHWSIAPCLIVDDMVATANYYRDKLGFHYERFWGERHVSAWSCAAASSSCSASSPRLEWCAPTASPTLRAGPDAYIWIENDDALQTEFKSKGVTITRDICDQPYGCR